MKSKLAMVIYILFAIASFLFGVKMFQMGDNLRGILFMVAVACWGMCIYNNSIMNRREKQRVATVTKSKKNNYMTKSSLKPLIENLSQYIYNDCFNIHNAVIDALIKNENKVSIIELI